MAKILIINVPAHGHVNPTIGLTKALIDAGHQVTYLVSESLEVKLRQQGRTLKFMILIIKGLLQKKMLEVYMIEL